MHSKEELFDNLREVVLATQRDIRPYTNAQIDLRLFRTDDLAPAQFYVLRRELEKISDLRCALGRLHVNMYKLEGYVKMVTPDGVITLLPPVIEESHEPDGSVVKIVNDGMHRLMHARLLHIPVVCVYITNVPRDIPYYAFPAPNGWDDVHEIEELGPEVKRKRYRIENYRSLYRDFSIPEFGQVGAPRPSTEKKIIVLP